MNKTYITYKNLFMGEPFIPYDAYPRYKKQYQIDRELACVHMRGISYNRDKDTYQVTIRASKTNYKPCGDFHDIIDAIIHYDEMVKTTNKYTRKEQTPYVKNGVLLYIGDSKHLEPKHKRFIDKYKTIFNYVELARLLKVDSKHIHKYLTSTLSFTEFNEVQSPTLIVWDVRDKFESMYDKLVKTGELTTEDVDRFIGLED